MLDGAQFEDAILDRIFAWRSDTRGANGESSRVIAPETTPKYRGLDCPPEEKDPCSWSASTFAMLKLRIERQVADDSRRLVALKGIAVLDPKQQPRLARMRAQRFGLILRVHHPQPTSMRKLLVGGGTK